MPFTGIFKDFRNALVNCLEAGELAESWGLKRIDAYEPPGFPPGNVPGAYVKTTRFRRPPSSGLEEIGYPTYSVADVIQAAIVIVGHEIASQYMQEELDILAARVSDWLTVHFTIHGFVTTSRVVGCDPNGEIPTKEGTVWGGAIVEIEATKERDFTLDPS